MDLEKQNEIRRAILAEPWKTRLYSEDFAFVYVDGRGKLKLKDIEFALHAAQIYSKYNYPNLLFVSMLNDPMEIRKITEKYSNTQVFSIPPLLTIEEYSQWMFNCFPYLIPPEYERIVTQQEDGCLIKEGWEDFVSKYDFDFIGAKWKSEVEAVSGVQKLKTIRMGNGGFSYRKRSSMIKCVEHVNKFGGQEKFFNGVKIDGSLRAITPYLAEDLMFCSVGFTEGFFKEFRLGLADVFSHEPIEYNLFLNKELRPFGFHKCDE